MNKVLILIYHRSVEAFLNVLNAQGMVHVDVKAAPGDEELSEKAKRIHRIKNVLKKMEDSRETAEEHPDPFSIIRKFESIQADVEQAQAQKVSIIQRIAKQSVWGNFDPEKLKDLHRISGIHARLLSIPKKHIDHERLGEHYYAVVHDAGHRLYIIVFEYGKEFDARLFYAEEYPLPDCSLSECKTKESFISEKIKNMKTQLHSLGRYRKAIDVLLCDEQSRLEFATVSRNLPDAVEGTVFVLNGWIPREKQAGLESLLRDNDVAYHISVPEPGDPVPVLMKNSRFSKLFEPITKLFDLPNYCELDLTSMFAPFFALFFGLCLGDAGYGLIIFCASMIMRRKVSEGKKGFCTLGAVLGVSTCVIGLVTGNIFGIDSSRVMYLQKIVLFNQDQLFNIALIIGLVQVLFGMGIKVINRVRQFGFLSSLSTVGWILIIIGGLGGYAAGPVVGWSTAGTGIGLILLFNDLKSNIVIRFGKGLWELYGITGVFGDILSYVRLFALGISSSILGFVVNDIGMQLKEVPYCGYVLAFVFIVAGHTGNLLISSLGSFVHPLRLTFVEFYKNAGFAGGGKAYKPFRKISNTESSFAKLRPS